MSFYPPNESLSRDSFFRRWTASLAGAHGLALAVPVPSGTKNPLWFRFAERIRDRVDASGLTRLELAALVGLTHSVLLTAEDGKHVPRLASVERIADALAISPTWLAYGDEGFQPFRQRKSRPVLPPDPPVPRPGARDHRELWRGVSARLADMRQRLGLTLRELGDAAGLSAQGIMLIEKGRAEPLISTVEQLAVALDVSPGWLAFGEGVPALDDVMVVPSERRPS
ncbi:MAG: helix-turn-helix domain-containing protein [Polyangia bacterium]